MERAREGFLAATSVHLVGRLTSGGKPVTLDLVLVGPRGGQGSITADGSTFRIIRIGELLWFKAPRSFYANQPALPIDLLADRWLEAPASSGQFAELAALTRTSKVVDQLLRAGERVTETSTTVAGVAAFRLSTSQGSVVVTATEPVRPLQAEGAAGSGDALAFSDYDAPATLAKPADVVTAAEIAAAGAPTPVPGPTGSAGTSR